MRIFGNGKCILTPTHNQHKERDSVWRILGGWWQGGWTAPEFELEKVTLRVTEISGGLPPAGRGNAVRFTPCRAGERRLQCGGLPPCRTGERRYWNVAVYPLPDGGTPGGLPPCRTGERRMQCGGLPPAGRGNAGRFTPCRTGERRFGMWRFTPLPDGGTPIWIVAVYAGYGNVTATIANVLPIITRECKHCGTSLGRHRYRCSVFVD